MAEYKLENKEAFTVIGFGTTVQYGEGDDKFAHIARQKSQLWEDVAKKGQIGQLQQLATDPRMMAINEAVNQEMWYYAGVISDAEVPEGARAINFPAGQYLVVAGQAATPGEMFGQLEGKVFGQILPSAKDFAYVGGPNAAVRNTVSEDGVTGEMWVPVVSK